MTTPIITAITATRTTDGVLGVGAAVTFSLAMSEVVTVNTPAGAIPPSLALNDNGTAAYVSGSGTNALTFAYTVAAGQNTPDLVVTAVNLNAATIKDAAGNAANLSIAGITQTGAAVDTAAKTGAAPQTGIATLGAIVGGMGYVSGTYLAVPLTGGTGTGATADITIVGGVVTAAVPNAPGNGYTVGDVLSAAMASIGGAGSGFTVTVATVAGAAAGPPAKIATVGQQVFFYPDRKHARGMKSLDDAQPFVAIVAYASVTGRRVNVLVIDHNGSTFAMNGVPMWQGDDRDDKKARSYCTFDIVPPVATQPGAIETLGTIVGGSNYTPGTYKAVALTGGSGTGATADVTVSAGGAVTVARLDDPGVGYKVGDVLLIAGAGTGFTVPVATVAPAAAVPIPANQVAAKPATAL
jgi:hypothetical protein